MVNKDAENEEAEEGGRKIPRGLERQLLRLPSKGGNKLYLPVGARIAWMRLEHPDWGITTRIVELNLLPGEGASPYAIFQATVTDEKGNILSQGTKLEDRRGFPDFIEKAETGAIGRALGAAGYGTPDDPELDEGERYADAPRGRGGPPVDPDRDPYLSGGDSLVNADLACQGQGCGVLLTKAQAMLSERKFSGKRLCLACQAKEGRY